MRKKEFLYTGERNMKRKWFDVLCVCFLVLFFSLIIFTSVGCRTFHASAEKAEITVSKEV